MLLFNESFYCVTVNLEKQSLVDESAELSMRKKGDKFYFAIFKKVMRKCFTFQRNLLL